MFGTLRQLFAKASTEPATAVAREPAPSEIALEASPSFPLLSHIAYQNGFPFLDWTAALKWIEAHSSEKLKGQAWDACERAWLLHVRDALGENFRLDALGSAALVSSLEPGIAETTLEFMRRTPRRIATVLDGITQQSEWGKDILIVFDDQDSYYHYVSHFYPEDGEYAFSSGMYLNGECAHFVTMKNELHSIEPIIAHEMTHGLLAHLPLPLWLNEGLAVNTEQRIAPQRPNYDSQRETTAKHAGFWGETEIQEYWAGDAFHRPDDGNALSYDLARVMVAQMAQDWEAFRQFALAADAADAGAKAARDHLNIDLGDYVAALLDRTASDAWAPHPDQWQKPDKA